MGHWFAFYQVKNLRTGYGEIGVAQSTDAGRTWQHLGTALAAAGYALSSPWVVYDHKNRQYIMIPDTHKAHKHSVQLYTTSQQDFPFGWKVLKTAVDGAHFLDTTGIHYQGKWWMFTTVRDCVICCEPCTGTAHNSFMLASHVQADSMGVHIQKSS